jgi:hypothetical protein
MPGSHASLPATLPFGDVTVFTLNKLWPGDIFAFGSCRQGCLRSRRSDSFYLYEVEIHFQLAYTLLTVMVSGP